jgi:pyridoxal phosphate enzyme (YggS family)
MADDARRDEIAAGLDAVRRRIADAATAAGRSADEVTLVAVTKFFPAGDVRILAELGVTDVGENRHPEAGDKCAECQGLGLRWHFIGALQSNKAAVVGSYADVVQSVDRAKLLRGLSRAAHERDRTLDVLLQVSLDEPGQGDGRSGVAPEDAGRLAEQVDAAEGLDLRGVMGVAPLGGDPAAAFDRLAAVAADVRAVTPTATWISAGMSGDLEEAVKAGATHVRVGTAVLGNRPGPR